MSRWRAALAAVALAMPAAAAHAEPALELALPLACGQATGCLPVQYVDLDPRPRDVDYRCGPRTYPDHNGTDISVTDLTLDSPPVAVLAAAAGVVKALRDDMDDINVDRLPDGANDGRALGNVVVLDHGDGWETYYGHLRRGSLAVAVGDRVAAGQPLGTIGLTGNTEFPHLHFSVRHDGGVVDPFSGFAIDGRCGGEQVVPLWRADALAALAYRSSGVLGAGFATATPDRLDARDGAYLANPLRRDAPALVFWIDLFGVRRGDRLAIRLTAPDGTEVAAQETTFDANHAQWFGFAGRRRRGDAWPPGRYRGTVTLTATGTTGSLITESREIEIR